MSAVATKNAEDRITDAVIIAEQVRMTQRHLGELWVSRMNHVGATLPDQDLGEAECVFVREVRHSPSTHGVTPRSPATR